MTLLDPIIAPVAADLLACLATEVAKTPDPPASVCLRPGDRVDLLLSTTYDECCSGLAWVRWVNQYPSANFPDPDEVASPCGVTRWAVTFELGVARCAPTSDAQTVPSCDQWIANTLDTYNDLAAVRRALCCYATTVKYQRLVYVGTAQPQTAEGGCVSVTMQVIVSAQACDEGCT
jgi:hypothetical protein